MHQTFYIDIDEEITSIVDRLRKSAAQEVVIVVPKRAILIQSIVNLKLLKKEADSLKKNLVLVTQDKLGKMLIEKTGILVQQRLDDVEGQEIAEAITKKDSPEEASIKADILEKKEVKPKKRFDEIGSAEYYQEEKADNILFQEESINREQSELGEERILNKELVTDMGDDLKKQKSSFVRSSAKKGYPVPMDMIRNIEISEENSLGNSDELVLDKKSKRASKKIFNPEKLHDFHEDDDEVEKGVKASRFLEHNIKKNNEEYKSVNVESNVWKYSLALGIFFIFAIASIGAYLYLPKVSIIVFPKSKTQSIDIQLEVRAGSSEVDAERSIIPAETVSFSQELTRSYDTTGNKNDSNQKAHGTLTIYNEFSSSPQPLVATTRFETPDGKIFRLVSGVTVPGTQKIGTENKPGAIEAKVIADKSGGQYNIGETSFTIPGFKGSGGEKYSKIYAKSTKPMTGGGEDKQEIKILSDADINSAKAKVAKELEVLIKQNLKESIGEDRAILDEAINMEDSTYTLSHSSGDATENFSITVKTTAKAIKFSAGDIRKVLIHNIAKKGAANTSVAENSIKIEYGKSDVDFKEGTMIVRIHASGGIVPDIDLEGVKRGILGKQEEDVISFINTYPDIGNMEISYWPVFISGRIPSYESRVDIALDPAIVLP